MKSHERASLHGGHQLNHHYQMKSVSKNKNLKSQKCDGIFLARKVARRTHMKKWHICNVCMFMFSCPCTVARGIFPPFQGCEVGRGRMFAALGYFTELMIIEMLIESIPAEFGENRKLRLKNNIRNLIRLVKCMFALRNCTSTIELHVSHHGGGLLTRSEHENAQKTRK